MPTAPCPTERACALTLSNLFLDGTLPEWQRNGMARDLANLPFNIDQIESFLWNDVYPALIWNLIAYTGSQHCDFTSFILSPVDYTVEEIIPY